MGLNLYFGLRSRKRRAAHAPAPGSDFTAASADDAAAIMAAWPATEAAEPWEGLLSINGTIYRYETHVHPGGELTEAWLDARSLDDPNDARQLYIIPKAAWYTDAAFDYTLGRRPGVVLGQRAANLTHDGTLRVVGANLYPEGAGNSTLAAEGQAGIDYAESIRDKPWRQLRGLWDVVGGGGSVSDPHVPGTGGAGGAGLEIAFSETVAGNPGTGGTNGGTGGGGSGGAAWPAGSPGIVSGTGDGTSGSTFSGGSGSGGARDGVSQSASPFGGAGSAGGGQRASGGAGNPGGTGLSGADPGESFTGGVFLMLGATIDGDGSISADGGDGGGPGSATTPSGGAASGGGSVSVAAVTYSGGLSVSAAGGVGGGASDRKGGDGGNGTARILTKASS